MSFAPAPKAGSVPICKEAFDDRKEAKAADDKEAQNRAYQRISKPRALMYVLVRGDDGESQLALFPCSHQKAR